MAEWTSFDEFLAAALAAPEEERSALVTDLLAERPDWPWIEGTKATFVLHRAGLQRVALNLDTIQADPPFAPMENLPGTDLWAISRTFEPDDLLDYMLARSKKWFGGNKWKAGLKNARTQAEIAAPKVDGRQVIAARQAKIDGEIVTFTGKVHLNWTTATKGSPVPAEAAMRAIKMLSGEHEVSREYH